MYCYLGEISELKRIDYYQHLPKFWKVCHDCYLGTPAIKHPANAELYLPLTNREKQARMRDPQSQLYEFRLAHSTYENFFQAAIDDSVGIMQKNPPHISFCVDKNDNIAQEVRDINVYGNKYNDGLKGLKWRLNFNQMLFGRYGLLMDVVAEDDGSSPKFIITEYAADQILEGEEGKPRANGHASLKWIRLDESKKKFDKKSKSWINHPKYRILAIDENGYYYSATVEGENALTLWSQFDFDMPYNTNGAEIIYPTFKGERLDFIPFTICNVNKLGYDNWQFPPFYDVATLGIGVYQMDSVYKKSLWNHASPTLGILNASLNSDEEGQVYLGDLLELSSQGNYPADAKMLETSAAGLQEMRLSKVEMKTALKYRVLRDLLDGAGANSSGDAIELRTVSGTSCIAAIDNAGALAIEEQLIYAAIWSGETSEDAADKISYEADTSYLNSELLLQSVVSLIQANANTPDGKPVLSEENIYKILQKTLPNTLSSFDDNKKQVESEYTGNSNSQQQNEVDNIDNAGITEDVENIPGEKVNDEVDKTIEK